MYKVLTTSEIAEKTGIGERSVRRRLVSGNVFGPTVMLINGKQVTYGATSTGVDNYLKSTKTR